MRAQKSSVHVWLGGRLTNVLVMLFTPSPASKNSDTFLGGSPPRSVATSTPTVVVLYPNTSQQESGMARCLQWSPPRPAPSNDVCRAGQKQPRGMAMNCLFSKVAAFAGLSLALVLAGAGCNAIDRVTDCQDICARYADCYDSTYDVSSCRSKCSDEADDNEDFDQLVDQCENCLDDRSCTSAVFSCSVDCHTIVP